MIDNAIATYITMYFLNLRMHLPFQLANFTSTEEIQIVV